MAKPKGLVFGVGVNDADYPIFKMTKDGRVDCQYYQRWNHMLRRCYSERWLKNHDSYKDCRVCDEWLVFSNFKSWMQVQDWKGKQLDKDILFAGNKLYSPENCVFISQELNKFMNKRESKRGRYMIGVSFHKAIGRFHSKCNDGSGRSVHLGYYSTEIEAHNAWKEYKRALAIKLAYLQEDERVRKALLGMYL